MRMPIIRGVIDRRVLVNYRIDPQILARQLPAPFRPKIVAGFGLAGICLIRLRQVRPRFLPRWFGFSSENAAHRVAVEWDEAGSVRQGVYVRRRDTDSWANTLTGGRLFPGIHQHAAFTTCEAPDCIDIAIKSDDRQTQITVRGRRTNALPAGSIFRSMSEASDFFQAGSLGYSPGHQPGCYQGLELHCRNWQVEPLEVERVSSSYFENASLFPPSSIEFDCALLMRGIEHEWHAAANLVVPAEPGVPLTQAEAVSEPA
jgi:hypothetical protein